MTDTDRLAALLRDALESVGVTLGVESRYGTAAARLIAAGVTLDPRPAPDTTLREALERLHAIAKVEGWSEPRGTMFEYVHHPDCDERCWVVRAALDAKP